MAFKINEWSMEALSPSTKIAATVALGQNSQYLRSVFKKRKKEKILEVASGRRR